MQFHFSKVRKINRHCQNNRYWGGIPCYAEWKLYLKFLQSHEWNRFGSDKTGMKRNNKLFLQHKLTEIDYRQKR